MTPDAIATHSVNPATGDVLGEHAFVADTVLDAALDAAHRAFETWRRHPVAERAAAVARLGSAIRDRLEPMARLATLEMGKAITQSRAEVEKCAALCDWYAAHGPGFLADEAVAVPSGRASISYLPTGVVLGIMPWNFPYWQALRAAVPILLGGNGFVLKPAENVVGCAGLLAEAVAEADLPPGLFGIVHATRAQVARAIGDRRVAGVTLTGSVAAGGTVASVAAQHLKKSVLELGGADPFIVLRDADLDAAAKAAALARFQNCGQVCIAAKRFIVERNVLDGFTERLAAATAALSLGDPLDDGTYLGPMARHDLRAQLHDQIGRTVAQGAAVRIGGGFVDGPGAYHAPTILTGVRPGMAAFDEETFGPVAAITVAEDADDAVRLANLSEYGLSGAVWSEDRDAARALCARLETGSVFVNSYSVSDPRLPIGGVKHSGYGRELSHFGIREFMNAQSVWIDRQ